jgi:hypothetical protein
MQFSTASYGTRSIQTWHPGPSEILYTPPHRERVLINYSSGPSFEACQASGQENTHKRDTPQEPGSSFPASGGGGNESQRRRADHLPAGGTGWNRDTHRECLH